MEVVERESAAFALDCRYPYLDRPLMEMCLSLPSDQKLHRGWNRAVMRRALDGILPEAVRWRRDKGNLGPVFDRGMLGHDRAFVESLIARPHELLDRYVDRRAALEIFRRYESKRGEGDSLTVWRVATLSLWLRQTGLTP